MKVFGVSALLVCLLAESVQGQVTRRVSMDSAGFQGNGSSGYDGLAISADGRFVAFISTATNLVPADTNTLRDVFLRDRQSGTTERVNVDSAGNQADGDNGITSAAVSADGRYVAFFSMASNLVPADTNAHWDVFVRDRQAGVTERVSVSSAGAQGNGDSYTPAISPDGRYVAFLSAASNLVPGDFNGAYDVFVRDRQNGTTELVSVGSSGAQGDGGSGDLGLAMTPDGRFVAFGSYATNLVGGDTNGFADVFLRDRQNGTTERISVSSAGVQGDAASYSPAISADGRYVAFIGSATTLVIGDTNATQDVFVRDRQTGTTERADVSSTGAQSNSFSANYGCSISGDGRYVTFMSGATNLVTADTNGHDDIFVRDLLSGTTERVSVDSSGVQGNGDSGLYFIPSISYDGRFVAFESIATNLVSGDTNSAQDVFVHDRNATSFTSLCDPGTGGVVGCPCANPPSGSGRGCNNSAGTGGAMLSAAGFAYLSQDTLTFTTSGEKPTATSVLLQGTTLSSSGVVYGQGIRCFAGTLKRLFTKAAAGGSITAPNFGSGDPTVSARSAAKGNPISAGQSRWYLVFYRDPIVLGGCPGSSTFNSTQTGRVDWSL